MLSRFLLMFAIAKYLPDTDMGLYGLITTTIVFSLYIVGLDFYIYSTRELIQTEKNKWGQLLKSQGGLVFLLYVIYIPIALLVFYNELLPWYIFPYLIVTLVLEHFCQECQRIIIADQKPLEANIGLFIRNGLWPLFLIPLIYFNAIPHSLTSVLVAWIIGDVLAASFFIYIVYSIGISGWQHKINWKWIINGVKICSLFLIGTLALRFSSVAERYWLQDLTTIEIVGVYSFFIGISGVVSNFLDAGVIAFKYPRLIKAYANNNKEEYLKVKKDLAFQIVIWTAILVVISLLMVDFVLEFIGKSIYFEYKSIYYFTLASTVVSCISLLPHYELYAQKRDKIIIASHMISLGVFFISGMVGLFFNKLYAIPISSLLTQIFIFLFKYISIKCIGENEYSRIN
ncbi:hypothetical protein PEC730217_02870 [Pectobacterium carotovorum subsp. carotovorum]|nr:hypothetical protein PEC730217_02870 [Pectobacterium carotovorum subsp. carotovorum]